MLLYLLYHALCKLIVILFGSTIYMHYMYVVHIQKKYMQRFELSKKKISILKESFPNENIYKIFI